MGQLKSTEWEVVSSERVPEDMNYIVTVIRCTSSVKKLTVVYDTRTIRLPYQPRMGQLINCPKLV
jgi:hypothetical protein